MSATFRMCSLDGCNEKHWAQEYCRRHYKRWKKNGTPHLVTTEQRFWSHVDKRGPNECWPWTASTLKGYGRGRTSAGYYYAHRRSYEMACAATLDPATVVRHRCDNPPCVNPAHLEVGTQADNVQDMIARERGHWHARTHCKRGHKYTPENTYSRRGGGRTCRTCVAAGRARRSSGISERRIGAA